MTTVFSLISVVVIVIVAYLSHKLTLYGSIGSLIIGSCLYLIGGLPQLITLYVFFISCNLVSMFKKHYKDKNITDVNEKNGNRDLTQVLANGLLPLILVVINYFINNPILDIAFYVSLAAATADTFASEIGVLSKEKPTLILCRKKVNKGISGAVTKIGLMASFIGSILIGITFLVFNYNLDNKLLMFLLITLFGFISCLIDSIYGETIQALYYNEETEKYTEKKIQIETNKKNIKVKGIGFINNDLVNILAPLTSVILYIIIDLLL